MTTDDTIDPMLQYFQWKHLPVHLQEVSRPFGKLAAHLVRTLPRNAERTVAVSPVVVTAGDLE